MTHQEDMLRKSRFRILTILMLLFGFQNLLGNILPITNIDYTFENQIVCRDIYVPSSKGAVTDFEHIFTPKQIKRITNRIQAIKNSTGNEIAIVSIDSTHSNVQNFDGYVLHLANLWGVGAENLNNGVLIGVSRQFRKIRICNGLAIETILSNEQTKEIIDTNFIPKFKKNKYFRGIMNGLDALETHFLSHQIVVA
jgi:uncharacterized protein